MVALLLGKVADANYKIQGCFKIRKRELPFEVVIVHDIPLRDLFLKRLDLLRSQRRHAAAAWHTSELRKI